MEASTSPSLDHRVLPLDGVRGLAALAIVLSHAVLFSSVDVNGAIARVGGALTVGVPVFFALSGFVIYAPFALARAHGQTVSRGAYAIRRFMRIAPPYWVLLTILTIAFGLAGVFSGDWWRYYGFASIYSATSSPFVDLANQPGLPPAWSLCVEVTFYLAIPFWAAVVAARRVPLQYEVTALTLLGVGSVVARRVILSAGSTDWVSHHSYLLYTLPTTFLWFVPGMLLALLVAQPSTDSDANRLSATLSTAWPWLAAACTAFALLCIDLPFDTGFVVSAIFGASVVGGCVVLQRRGRPVRWLEHSSLLLLGAISYSLYLVHFPVLRWWADDHRALGAIVAVAVPAVLALAWISYVVIERPSHDRGRRWSRAKRVPAAP